ncbi:MAG: PAS-domain containing protein [Lysobacterales bacterium]|jgi:Na+/proline symporter/signal transduction histidine kinase
MLSPWLLIVTALGYTALLFAIAWVGDRKRIAQDHRNIQAVIYSLSLAVYCTSWTFYGAVGSAATTGWGFLPIYLGPALVFLIGHNLIRKMALTSRDQRITSIADYIAYRYGRSHSIAVLVTFAAVIGSLPYIALQLKGISIGFDVISRATGAESALPADIPLYLALALALFAILFGTRNLDASEHHRGLMWAIAFESIVKLLAFLSIGLFVVFGIFGGFGEVAKTLRETTEYQTLFSPWRFPEGFGVQLVLAMAAILCLPRQFHVAVVEFRDTHELKLARWLFPLYLMLFASFVVPIALAGLTQFSGQDVNPDTYVLSLPIAFNQNGLTVLAFLGGFSAATGMVIVATVALAIMVSNDIVMPLLLRTSFASGRRQSDLSRTLLRVRRVSILAITLLAYLYYRAIEGGVALASIGLLSFSAAAQFAPAMLIGLYWKAASRAGAIAGLTTGAVSWFLLLLLPSLNGGSALGLPDIPFNEGAAWSLFLNAFAVVMGSLFAPDFDPAPDNARAAEQKDGGLITIGELQKTIGRFLGMENTVEALATHLGTVDLEATALASPATVQFGERLLAGSIGSASARTVLTTALHHRGLGPDAVMELLDQTSQAVQFNRELLEATLDNMSQGVSVVDRDLCLVGWNRRYLEMMNFSEDQVYLGQPIEELILLNAKRGLIGKGDHEAETRKRVERLRIGAPYVFERPWVGDRVLEIRGNPMPGGGYVTTFTDITHYKEIERELQEINETLEQRVEQRTRELSEAIREVEEARTSAEAANQSKTRFLAAASHDLLQPMNAARLFVSILRQQADPDKERGLLVKRVDRSLTAAEELLSALLDISKLDSGMFQPEPELIPLEELFEQLRRRFKPLAANRDLQLRVRKTKYYLETDRKLLYRILQNFLANAIRYTERGGVLLGCRRRSGNLRISVWDTGVGIDEADLKTIFQEFHRLDYAQRQEERGLGLGLAICDRSARMLGLTMDVRSTPGKGSCFSITVPLAESGAVAAKTGTADARRDSARLEGQTVLCIDNEPEILEGMQMLLSRWGYSVMLAEDQDAAEQQVRDNGAPDIVLVDYHLADHRHGLDVMEHLARITGQVLCAIVITADRSVELEEAVQQRGYALLRKPIKPAALRALMANTLKTEA